jgi:lipopolysaccharide export system protein LptA
MASLSLCSAIVNAQQSTETGLITIESDQQTADNSIGVVTAQGNVRLVHVDRGIVATGRQAQYFMKEERIVLSGDVDIVQKNGDLLQADKIVYSLADERAWRRHLRINRCSVNGVLVVMMMIQPL